MPSQRQLQSVSLAGTLARENAESKVIGRHRPVFPVFSGKIWAIAEVLVNATIMQSP
jgi:hypothetical protein